jgi:hypothetical protein
MVLNNEGREDHEDYYGLESEFAAQRATPLMGTEHWEIAEDCHGSINNNPGKAWCSWCLGG